MKYLVVSLIAFALLSCRSDTFFQVRKYYGNGATIEFYPDHSFQYVVKSEGGYVSMFGSGIWRQERNKLFLSKGIITPGELFTKIREVPSKETDIQIVINILPKKIYFPHLSGALDLLNVELVIDSIIYPLKNESNIIRLQKSFDRGYIRAYPKPNAEINSEILNDTLRSQYIDAKGLGDKILSIDVDSNPLYFAQVKMGDDTLQIISKRKIKWSKIYLERPR